MFRRFGNNVFIQPLRWICIILGLLVLYLFVIWMIWLAPEIKKIPDNFSYTADILSLDNFYDEKTQKFQGEHISKTVFSYDVVAKTPEYLKIRNIFAVSTLNEKPIISITRFYYINPYTGQHVPVPDVSNRVGYLFAPQYASKNGYVYWHVNYNSPAHLKFVNEEKIDGLTVYHYRAHYSADQTADLNYLPGVPEKRGIKTDIILNTWIEPISGWLVKYKDNTLAYYYDRKTGKEIAPWNKFSNTYTLNSVRQQVRLAYKMKWRILAADFIVPAALIILAALLLTLGFMKNNIYPVLSRIIVNLKALKKYVMPAVIVILIGLSLWPAYYIFLYKQQPRIFKIGISKWYENAEINETIRGFKDELAHAGFVEGKNIKYIVKNPDAKIENQIDIIQSFIEQKVNLIYTFTTPGTLVAKGITKVTPIVFANVTYPVESDIINSLKSSGNNLVGVRNYISAAVQYNKFEKIYPSTKALGFVHHRGDPDSELQYEEFKSLLDRRNIQVLDLSVIDLDDLAQQLKQQRKNYDSLYISCDSFMQTNGGIVVAGFGLSNKIPNFSCDKDGILNGSLMGYIADPYTMGLLAGKQAELILRGADPSWLHTISPDNGSLIINLATARALGITVDPDMIQQADFVIDY